MDHKTYKNLSENLFTDNNSVVLSLDRILLQLMIDFQLNRMNELMFDFYEGLILEIKQQIIQNSKVPSFGR